MSNYSLIKLSPPSSCGFSHFELQEKIKQHTGGRTHVSCSHAGSLWRACKSPAAPPPPPETYVEGCGWSSGWKERNRGKEWGQWSETRRQKEGSEKSQWITTEDQNSFGFVMWQKKQIQEKQLLYSEAQWGNEKKESQRGETGREG